MAQAKPDRQKGMWDSATSTVGEANVSIAPRVVSVTPQRHGLSNRQRRILQAICDYVKRRQYAPSMRDIQIMADISSTSVVHYDLRILAHGGYTRRAREVSRSTVVTPLGWREVGLEPPCCS